MRDLCNDTGRILFMNLVFIHIFVLYSSMLWFGKKSLDLSGGIFSSSSKFVKSNTNHAFNPLYTRNN
jgi:hypothetical protein